MSRGLRFRLAATHALVALLAVAVVATIIFVIGERRFDSYLEDAQTARNQSVVRALTDTYTDPAGWDAAAVFAVSQVAASANVDVAVYSPEGSLIFTAQGRHAPGQGRGSGRTVNPSTPSASPNADMQSVVGASGGQLTMQSYPIVVADTRVGRADIYSAQGARQGAEQAYLGALSRNLLIAALIGAGLAVPVSLLVSRRMTGPLEELTDAARHVANGNLDVRVAPRTGDEVGDLAVAFNAMADRLARDEEWRRDMTADLSHELRTPLATIQSRVEALEDGVLPPTPENLRIIGEEVERLGRLLGALRNLNELESEDLDVDMELLDLADVGRDGVLRASATFSSRDVELNSMLTTALVRGDRDRLLQVISNLLDNALKYAPSGSRVDVSVEVTRAMLKDARMRQRWACLTVSDAGPGIDSADLPFVFDRFYRGRSARGTQGAGLGLAIARGLVEAHGGLILAASNPEGGARFSVYLPLAD
ncbi:MAG: HAMP domain-containing sensor histidine kinase [Thermoleophilia bacterium]